MGLKARIALLLCLAATAIYIGGEAVRSLEPVKNYELPEEIYTAFLKHESQAQYFLRSHDGYVTVYTGKRGSEPMSTTPIEIEGLRTADRAMLDRGIPVVSRIELLSLLEDLGS